MTHDPFPYLRPGGPARVEATMTSIDASPDTARADTAPRLYRAA